jgi:hypothetical protein
MMHSRKQKRVKTRLVELEQMDRAALIETWTNCYGSPPPNRVSRPLLIKAVAYKLQEKAFGGLSANARKALEKIGSGGALKSTTPLVKSSHIKPGTRFIREWHGQLIEVLVDEAGKFVWNEKAYPSLTAIASKVTNTKRNGPAFFCLRER